MWFGRLAFFLFSAGFASGQTFEVVSIRLSNPKSIRGSEGGPGSKDPVRFTFNRVTLEDFLLIAYDAELFQISSKSPLDRDEFDMTAKLPPSATKDDFRAMMKNFFVERFQAKLHLETRDFPAFELVRAKGGTTLGAHPSGIVPSTDFPQLDPDKPGLIAQNVAMRGYRVTRIRGQQQRIFRLAKILRTAEPRPILDRTGLDGVYDFTLAFSIDLPSGGDSPAEPPGVPDLNTALREQLGLQIVTKSLPFQAIVVDSFNRFPTEN